MVQSKKNIRSTKKSPMRKLKKNKLFHGGEAVAINNIIDIISLIEAHNRDNKCDRYFYIYFTDTATPYWGRDVRTTNTMMNIASKLPTIYTIRTKHWYPNPSTPVSDAACMDEQNKESSAFDEPKQTQLRKTAYDSAIQRWTLQYKEYDRQTYNLNDWDNRFLKWGKKPNPINPGKEPVLQKQPGVFCEITIIRKIQRTTKVLLSVVANHYVNRTVVGHDTIDTNIFLLLEHLLNIDPNKVLVDITRDVCVL